MGALRFLLSLLLAVQVLSQCNLRLRLSDSAKDGWNGNELALLVAGKTPSFTVVGSFAKVLTDGSVTLVGGDTGSLQFTAPSGAPITFTFKSDAANWPSENSWSVELFDAYAPFGTIVLTKSALNSARVPVSPNIANVVCGPRPVMTGFTVNTIPGPYAHQVKFDWPSLAASDADQTVTYTVSYRNLADTQPNNWIILVGGTTISEVTAILPPNTNLQFQLIATNQYGPGSAVTWTYSVPTYPATAIYVKLYDSLSNGWGSYDGFVWLALNGITIGSATFPCTTPGTTACASITIPFLIPNGIAWTLTSTFQAPSVSPADCSYRITNATGTLTAALEAQSTLFNSGQGPTGPTTPNAKLTISYPGTPVPVNAPAPPKAVCPTAEPAVGATCPGVTAAPCSYDQTCCCPNEPIASNRYCASDTYVCTGTNGKWQQTLTSLPCKTDTTFRCPSQCPLQAPTVAASCTAAITCNYPVACAGTSTCTQTDTYACTGTGTALAWKKTTNCQCKTLPQCAAWQYLQNSGNCCTSPPTCVTDPTSTVCLTPGPWSTCTGTCVNGAGTGKQTRTTYTRNGITCTTATASQSCALTCPVACVGAFGAYTNCTATCGAGTQQRVYKVTTPSKNNGTACPYADGFIDVKACVGTSTCGPMCNLQLLVFDSMKDGWTGGAQVSITYPGLAAPVTATVPLNKASNVVTFSAPRGMTLTVSYTSGTDPRPTDHSYEIASVVPPSPNLVTLLQNPTGLALKTKPDATKTVVVQCIICTAANIDALCANLHRRSCSNDKVADNTCGACLPGYTGTKSGNTACTDVNECTAGTPCGAQVCTNTIGSYTCTCKPGWVMQNGNCVQSCPEYSVRKEWGDLTPAEKDKFIRACRALGGEFWGHLGQIHLATFYDPSNIHGNGLFLPWHRGFLKDVEDRMIGLPGDLSCTYIPYWDWTRVAVSNDPNTYIQALFSSAKTPDGLWTGFGVLGSTPFQDATPEHPFSPIIDCFRGDGFSIPWNAYGPAKIYSLLRQPTFTMLYMSLNGYGHNSIHNYVGGIMATGLSAWDPIFFMHHAFIDLMWGAWQSCNNLMDASNPGELGWDPSLSFTKPMPPSLTKTYTPQMVYNSESIKVRWAKAYLARVTGFNAAYCQNQASTWFAMLETEVTIDNDLGSGQNLGGYPVDLGVVSNTSDTSDYENETQTVVVVPVPTTPPVAVAPLAPAAAGTPTVTSTSSAPPTDNGAPVQTTKKTKLKKRKKGPKKVGVESQMDHDGGVTDNVLCSFETYKTVLEKTGDADQALSAQIDEECSQSKFTFQSGNMFPEPWLVLNPHLRRTCAMGDCYHECYLRSSGPNAAILKSDYEKGKENGTVTTRKKIRSHKRKDITPGSAPVARRKRRGVTAENATSTAYSAKALIESLALRLFN